MTTLQLKYPVNFVIPDKYLWEELRRGAIDEIDSAKLSKYAAGERNSWVGSTYFYLLKAGQSVSRSPRPRRGVINIVPARDFGRRDRHPDDFIVIPRGDAHRPTLANFTIVQCTLEPTGPATTYMPLWPQANIRPRDHTARPSIEHLSFKGRLANLDPSFRSQSFIDALSGIGVKLVLDAFDGLMGEHDWGDYTDTDAVIAARNLTREDALHKPASKLVNAWFGETPALLGPEPAFQGIKKSHLDYIEIKTPQDVIGALRELREKPDLYMAMIENGRERRKDFTVEHLTSDWVRLFNETIGPHFERWENKSVAEKRLRWVMMMIGEPLSKRYYRYYISHGQRLLYPLPARSARYDKS